jgi:hypothetical protein
VPSPPPRLLSGGVVGSGQETYVEGEGLRFTDYDGAEVGVGRVQEVVAFALYDDARHLEHGAYLAPDPLVAYALELGRSRVGMSSIGQHRMVQALYEGVVEAGSLASHPSCTNSRSIRERFRRASARVVWRLVADAVVPFLRGSDSTHRLRAS